MPTEPTSPARPEIDRVTERLGTELAASGIPRMSAHVYAAILTSSEGELTAAEIGKRLQISAATVSKAVQYVLQVRLVQRGYVPGTRRDRYMLGEDFWAGMFDNRGRWLRSLADVAAEGVAALGESSQSGTRLATLRDFSEFAASEMDDLYERWQRKQGQ